MKAVIVYLMTTLSLVIILLMVSVTILAKLKANREKYSVFECGFDLMSHLRLPISINFFLITIIFLVFDVELIMVLPFIFNFTILNIKLSYYWIMGFFIVLFAGFIYEWLTGLLNWVI